MQMLDVACHEIAGLFKMLAGLFNISAGLSKRRPGHARILDLWRLRATSRKEYIMRQLIAFTKWQDGALAVALIGLLAGSCFALLQAFGANASIGLIGPLLAPV
jgi:hypothetical protein